MRNDSASVSACLRMPPRRPAPRLSSASAAATPLEASADRRAPPRRLTHDLRRDLSRNQLATLPERVFAGLASLKELNLRFNQLATLPERVFEGLASLEVLCVRARVVCAAARVAAGGARGLRRCWRRAPTDALRRAAPPTHSLTHSFALALAPRDAPQGT